MNTFCTNCGAALRPDTPFCTGCGAAVPTVAVPARKPRRWAWILALLLVFALGLWLGHRLTPMGPQCPAPPVAGAGGSGGGGGGGGGHAGAGAGGGKGDPDKGDGGGATGTGRVLGDGGRVTGSGGGGSPGSGQGTGEMTGGGQGNINGTTVGHGNDGTATGANGSDDSGGGVSGGKPRLNGTPNGPDSNPDMKQRTEVGVWRLAAGAPMSTSDADGPQATFKDVANKVLSARDFSYDKTGLPRYPDANQAVFSALAYDVPDHTDAYGTASGIVTGSTFDDAVSWYRKNLPAGWSSTTIGDLNRFGAMAQQLSPEKIMQMLGAANSGTTAKPADDIPATAAAARSRISMFSPPAGTKGNPGVLIVQQGDKPVVITMKAHIGPGDPVR